MSKFVGFIIGGAEIAIGLATANPALIVQGGLTIAAQAIVDLTAPKTPAREASEMTIKLGEQPRVLQVGETYTPGSMVDAFDYGGKYGTDWEVVIIRLADHKCDSLTGFFVNDEYKLYRGDGNVLGYNGQLKIFFRSDTTNQPLPDIVTDHGPGWTSGDVGESGCDVIVAYKADSPKAKHPVWTAGRPRFGFVLKGKLCYDPRKDDTVTGGSGPHRWDDGTTWEWSENAIICWYNFEKGVYANDDTSDQTKLLVGRGLNAEESPPGLIFAAANLCDEQQGAGFPFALLDGALSTHGAQFSPDFSELVAVAGTGYQVWNLYTRSLIYSATLGTNIGNSRIAINEDGSFYTGSANAGDYTALVSRSGAITKVAEDPMGSMWSVAAGLFGRDGIAANRILQLVGDTVVRTTTGFFPGEYFDDHDVPGQAWGVGGVVSGGSFTTGLGFCDLLTLTSTIIPTTTSGEGYALDNGNGQFFTVHGSYLYLINKATLAIDAGPVSAAGASDMTFRSARPGDRSIWINWSQYSTQDLSLIETVDPADWPSGGTTADPLYDPIDDAMLTEGILETGITMRYLHRNGGYRVSGPIYANQAFIDVEQMFAAATAGSIVTRDGSVEIEPGQAKSVVATFTDGDLITGSSVSYNRGFLSESSDEWINTVVGTYVEPDQKWNSHSAPPVRNTSDIIADGKPREAQLALRLVRYRSQAMRIAEIARRLGRLWARAAVTLGPRFCELEDGDWINWQSDRYFGGDTKTFRIDAYSIDASWQIKLTLREVNGSAFADDGSFDDDLSIPTMTPPPPDVGSPESANWTLTAATLDSAGASVPALVLTGTADDDDQAEAIIVEYWLDDGVTDPTTDPDSVTWTMAGRYAPTVDRIEITSLAGGSSYYLAVSYVVNGVPGDRLVIGPQTVADLDVSGQLSGLAPKYLTIDTVTGSTYTIAVTDEWHHKRFTSASAITITVPTNATAAYPIGARTRITQAGAGQITLAPAGGVTLNSRSTALKSAGQLAVFEIEKIATDEWDVLGDVTA